MNWLQPKRRNPSPGDANSILYIWGAALNSDNIPTIVQFGVPWIVTFRLMLKGCWWNNLAKYRHIA